MLLLNEPGDLFDTAPPDDLSAAIRQQEARMERAFDEALGAQTSRDEAFARLRFAVIDGPAALIRPYLRAGEAIPAFIDGVAAGLGGLVAEPSSQRQAAE